MRRVWVVVVRRSVAVLRRVTVRKVSVRCVAVRCVAVRKVVVWRSVAVVEKSPSPILSHRADQLQEEKHSMDFVHQHLH